MSPWPAVAPAGRGGMTAFLIATVVGAGIDVEAVAGYLGPLDQGDPSAVMTSIRAGYDFRDFITLGGRFIWVPGPEGQQADRGDPSGMVAWAALAELRVHTPAPVIAHVAFALGPGGIHARRGNGVPPLDGAR